MSSNRDGIMRPIKELIWHCTATPEGREVSVVEIDAWHKARGWSRIGYHKVVHLDGTVSDGRPISKIGAHVRGKNTGTIGYVYVGGVEKDGRTPKDTRTAAQKRTMRRLTKQAIAEYGLTEVSGHRDYAAKACPCFDARAEYRGLVESVSGKVDFGARADDILERGDYGPAVAEWRRKLAEYGYDVPPGTVFDQLTEQCTRWFQRARGIVIDGQVGPQTIEAMDDALNDVEPRQSELAIVRTVQPPTTGGKVAAGILGAIAALIIAVAAEAGIAESAVVNMILDLVGGGQP